MPQHAVPRYPWARPSFVLTNALMMGLAYDFHPTTRSTQRRCAGMDTSGAQRAGIRATSRLRTRPLQNPYHRFWCHQANPKYPARARRALGRRQLGPGGYLCQAAGLKGLPPQKSFSTTPSPVDQRGHHQWTPRGVGLAFLDEQVKKASGGPGRRRAPPGMSVAEGVAGGGVRAWRCRRRVRAGGSGVASGVAPGHSHAFDREAAMWKVTSRAPPPRSRCRCVDAEMITCERMS